MTISAKETLSKAQAAGDYLCIPEGIDWLAAFDAAIEGLDKLEALDIQLWEPIDDFTNGQLDDHLSNHQRAIERSLSRYGAYIKRAITLFTIDATLLDDVNDWDIDTLATVGMNTSQPQTIENQLVKFDMVECLWVSTSGNSFAYSRENGLPVSGHRDIRTKKYF